VKSELLFDISELIFMSGLHEPAAGALSYSEPAVLKTDGANVTQT